MTIFLIVYISMILSFSMLLSSSPTTLDLYLVEECANNTEVTELHSKLPSKSYNNVIFRILGKSNLFYIETKFWKLRTKSRIDREAICSNTDNAETCIVTLYILYQSSKMSTKPVMIKSVIHILDINDHAPTWNRQDNRIEIKIPEHSPINKAFNLPEANDMDCGPQNITKYYYISKTTDSYKYFDIKVTKKNGQSTKSATEISLIILSDLDREKQSEHQITIVAVDGGNPPLSGELKVNIEIKDINDHPPKFKNSSPVIIRIKENELINYKIFKFEAEDLDSDDVNNLKYSFARTTSDDSIQTFWLKENYGNLMLQKYLDYESKMKYTFSIQVSDGTFQSSIDVEIIVINVNDNSPKITIESFAGGGILSVPENLQSGQHVGAVVVTDADDKSGVMQLFCIINNPIIELYPLDDGAKNTFLLKTTKSFDREERSYYVFTITCSDTGDPMQNSSITTRLQIKDINDNSPTFLNMPMTAIIKENMAIGTFIYQIRVQDHDLEENANFRYSLSPECEINFRIDKDSGQIFSRQLFDAEQESSYEILVIVTDKPDSTGHKVLGSLNLSIEDINDNSPIFEKDVYSFITTENSKSGTLIGQIKAKDNDVNEKFHSVQYNFKPSTETNIMKQLSITNHGKIYIKTTHLDREDISSFAFYAIAVDNGNPPFSSSTYVQIEVRDLNDNTPEWVHPDSPNSNINITYRLPVGHEVTKFQAKDIDQGKNSELEYFIAQLAYGNGIFQLQPSTGVLYIARTLTTQDIRTYWMVIGVKDHGQPPLSKLRKFTINIVHHLDESKGTFALFGKFEGDLLIILVLVIVTLLICLGLISAIWFLKCGARGGRWCKEESFNQRDSLRPPDGHSPSPNHEILPIFLSRRHDSFFSNATKTTYIEKKKDSENLRHTPTLTKSQSVNNKNNNYYQCLKHLSETDRTNLTHNNLTMAKSQNWTATSSNSSIGLEDQQKSNSKSQTLPREICVPLASSSQLSVRWYDKHLHQNDDEEYQICISNRSTPKFPIIRATRSPNLKDNCDSKDPLNSDYTQLASTTAFQTQKSDSDLPMSYV